MGAARTLLARSGAAGALSAALLAAAPAVAHDGPIPAEVQGEVANGLFVNLTSAAPDRAWMALHFALSTRKLGYPVTVFLNLDAVKLANAARPEPRFATAQQAPLGYVQSLLAEGAAVLICGPCLAQHDMAMADVAQGVLPGAPGMTQRLLFAPGVRTLTW